MPSKDNKPHLFVSYYANRRLSNEAVKPISISRGNPRFRISYKIEGRIPDLAPGQEAWGAGTEQGFADAYIVQLEKLGVEKIQAILDKLKDDNRRPIVLLCFEDLIREDKMFCHRQVFAGWWEHHTGMAVQEYESPSLVAEQAVKVFDRRGNLPAITKSSTDVERSRLGSHVISPLSEFSIYVNASNNHLEDADNKAGLSKPITEKRRWVRGRQLWLEAEKRGEELPLIFSTFKELAYWALAKEISLDDEACTTTYRFADLRPLQGYERENLEVATTRKKLPNTYIRSYVPVLTPAFLTA